MYLVLVDELLNLFQTIRGEMQINVVLVADFFYSLNTAKQQKYLEKIAKIFFFLINLFLVVIDFCSKIN
jgi:TRAP-type mannitol/chloroaromatic compound transport system permease small subunit